jgi:hypothetical protein
MEKVPEETAETFYGTQLKNKYGEREKNRTKPRSEWPQQILCAFVAQIQIQILSTAVLSLSMLPNRVCRVMNGIWQQRSQNRDIKIANRSFENVSQFKYLWTAVTNQNLIQEEIKRRLNSGNACYHSVLSSRLLSKKLKN